MNNTTRRHPRTLQEAFGPYCSHRIHEDESATYRGLRAAVCIAAAVLIGWLAAHGG